MMIKRNAVRLAHAVFFLTTLSSLNGCGGGGTPAATYIPPITPTTPSITIYGTSFDLADTVVSGTSSLQGTLVNCPTGGTEIELKNEYYKMITVNNMTSYWHTFYIYLSGNFTLPNGGQISCNTTGISGTITRQRFFDVNNALIFDMTNIDLPANAMQSGWQSYWKAVLAQSGHILSTQSSVATITCTNSQNTVLSFQLTSSGDISSFINQCVN